MHKILKIFLGIFAICYACLQLNYYLFDISTRCLDPEANPDLLAKEKIYSKGIYLVSYAHGNEVFFQNQNALAQSALNRGIDFTFNYRKSHIDKDFYEKNKAILDEKAGAGYWLWKPYVILKALEETPEGSIIVYADSGSIFTGSIMPILKHLEEHDGVLYRYSEEAFATTDKIVDPQVAEELKATDFQDFKTKKHLWAGFMVLRNCAATKEFIKQWLELCQNPNFLKGYGKGWHLHDQALFNIMFLKKPEKLIALPGSDFDKIIKWNHRHPNEALYSLMPYQQQNMSYYEHKAWRFPPLKWLRYVLFHG